MLRLPSIPDKAPADFHRIIEAARPVVFRDLVSRWPAVALGRASPEELRSYLLQFDVGMAVEAYVAPSDVGGHFFYSDDMNGFNFERGYMRLADATAMMIAEGRKERKNGVYAGSIPIKQVIPGFEKDNVLPLLADKPAEGRIWLGNETVVAAHWDSLEQCRLRGCGKAAVHAFPARAGSQPLCRANRQDGLRAAGEHGRHPQSRFRKIPPISPGARGSDGSRTRAR